MDRNQFHFSSTRKKKGRRKKTFLLFFLDATQKTLSRENSWTNTWTIESFRFVLLRMMRLLIKCHRSNARELPVDCDVNNDEFNRFFFRSLDGRTHSLAHEQIEFRPEIRIWFTSVQVFCGWQMSATHMCQLILGFVSQFSNSNRKLTICWWSGAKFGSLLRESQQKKVSPLSNDKFRLRNR